MVRNILVLFVFLGLSLAGASGTVFAETPPGSATAKTDSPAPQNAAAEKPDDAPLILQRPRFDNEGGDGRVNVNANDDVQEKKAEEEKKAEDQKASPRIKNAPAPRDMCTITGRVLNIRKKIENPWPGAPSIFAKSFTEIIILVENSKLHRKLEKTESSRCDRMKPGRARKYRICSVTKVKKGDIIRGNEGASSGSLSRSHFCIFDIQVLKKKKGTTSRRRRY